MKSFDVAVIGGGPGGYVAALRAAKEGRRVALVEADQLGGTCLNRGCIPSKTLLRHADVIEEIRQAKAWGIETGDVQLSLEKMMARKDQVIQRLRAGIAALLKAGKVTVYNGRGVVRPDKTIAIDGAEPETIQASSIILATGSMPFVPPIAGLDQVPYHTSDTIFSLTEIPQSVAIIGGGVIGVEFARIFASLGSAVSIVEMAPRLVPNEDPDAAAALAKALQKRGVSLLTDARVESAAQRDGRIVLEVSRAGGEKSQLATDTLLVSVGRKPNLSGIDQLGLTMDGPFVRVNEYLETNIPGIYAIGDLIGGWQLAHVASAEGLTAARNACGERVRMDYKAVPRCIYTHPEVASVGLSEAEAKAQGYAVKTAVYPLPQLGKMMAMDERDGFVKVIAEEKYGEILGVVMVGPHVTEMISTATAYLHLEGTMEELAGMIFPHPTVSEGLLEAAASWLGKGIHA